MPAKPSERQYRSLAVPLNVRAADGSANKRFDTDYYVEGYASTFNDPYVLFTDWDGNELLLSDILGTDEDVIYRGIENEVERKLLMNAVSKLSKREKTIIRLRFGLGTVDGQEMTQKEVANLLGISQSYISRLEKKIMRQLKKEISLHI